MSDDEARARDEGIARAMGSAPVGWGHDALQAVKHVAERRTRLSADDVWDRLASVGARTPPTRSALAGVLKQAAGKRLAWIEPTNESTMSEGGGRHRSRIMVWRSLICGSPQAQAWADVFAPLAPAGPGLGQRREADQGRRSGRSGRR